MPEANTYAQPGPSDALIGQAVRDILTDAEVAKVLRVSVEKIRRMRYSVPPRGPRFFRIDRSVRYRLEDVLTYVQGALVATAQQPLDDEPTPTSPKRLNPTPKQRGGRRAA